MYFPTVFTAGTTLTNILTIPAYPAGAGWVLRCFIRGPANIDLASITELNQHKFTQTAADTAAWQPGVYAYTIRAELAEVVEEIEVGTLEIKPNIATMQAGVDCRSHARKVLDAIEAVIEKRATQDQEKYRINERELWRTPLADLMKLRATYQDLVRKEKNLNAGRKNTGRMWRMRFGSAR